MTDREPIELTDAAVEEASMPEQPVIPSDVTSMSAFQRSIKRRIETVSYQEELPQMRTNVLGAAAITGVGIGGYLVVEHDLWEPLLKYSFALDALGGGLLLLATGSGYAWRKINHLRRMHR